MVFRLLRISLTYGLGMSGRFRRGTAFAVGTRWYMYMREADMRNLNDARTAFAARAAMTTPSVAVVICGLLIFLVGLSFLFGMIGGNVSMFVAGPFLIVAIMLMAIGVYVMSKGHKKFKAAERTETDNGIRYTKD